MPDFLDGLPLVVEDAICVCNEIGIEYLWVDRYCIPQDPDVARHQIANMDSVYAGSALTIIAAAGETLVIDFLESVQD
jgi:hypothetical protein